MPTTRMPSRGSKSLETLEDHRGTHAAAGAHRHDTECLVAPSELTQHRHDHAGAGRCDGMAEAGTAAVDVGDRLVDAELAGDGDRHGAEGFVDLPEVDVTDGQACSP